MSTDSQESRLEALGAMTQETDADNPALEVQQERAAEAKEAAAVDESARAWGMIPFTIGGTLAILCPDLRAVYNEDACYAWGQGAAAVSRKYGWDAPDNMPELALLASTLGFAVPSYLAIREKLDEVKAGKASGLWARLGVWWRARQAAKAAKKPEAPGPVDTAAAGS